jgi:hypothetical protein
MNSLRGYKIRAGLLAIGGVYLLIALLTWTLNPIAWPLPGQISFSVLSLLWVSMLATSEIEPAANSPKKRARPNEPAEVV